MNVKNNSNNIIMELYSSVGIGVYETVWVNEKSGLIPGNGQIFVSSVQRTDQAMGPHSLLHNTYRRVFPRG
jgi:hypothetical protein